MWEEARKSLILCGKMAFPVKWGIYFINVFRGRDRQKLPPVKYEKVYLFQACCPVTIYRIVEKCVEILCCV